MIMHDETLFFTFQLQYVPFISSIRFNIFAAFATSCGDAVAPYGLSGLGVVVDSPLFSDDGVLLLDLLLSRGDCCCTVNLEVNLVCGFWAFCSFSVVEIMVEVGFDFGAIFGY